MKDTAEAGGEMLDVSVYEARAARLVEAMLCYGLIEEDVVRANYKPLHATARLHVLMMTYHANYSLLLTHAIEGDAGPRVEEGIKKNA